MKKRNFFAVACICVLLLGMVWAGTAAADDLDKLRARGELRHLGEPYANFITGAGDGLTVDLMKAFARHLGVRYRFVPSTWGTALGELLGRRVTVKDGEAVLGPAQPVLGDVWAGGVTVLPWRQKVAAFSEPTFPSQIWLVARASAKLRPIKPSGDTARDVAQVKAQVDQLTILCVPGTCLDGRQYQLDRAGARLIDFGGKLNEMVPAAIDGEAQAVLQDASDAMISLQKWAGDLKVIGPVSPDQKLAAAFAPSSPRLRQEFNRFLARLMQSGEYRKMAQKYYPTVVEYFPGFFAPNR